MCGRAYVTFNEQEMYDRYFDGEPFDVPPFKPNYNLAPREISPVVRIIKGQRRVDLLKWGIIPKWEPEPKTKFSTINARSDKVFESKLYKDDILHRRCIIPVSGFIEWKRDKNSKHPFCIYLKDEPIMSLAGIWDTWRSMDGKREIECFTILTTDANKFVGSIHNRMPVIMDPKKEEEWLDSRLEKPQELSKFLKPCPASWLDAYEVSTAINSPKNNRPEVLRPKDERGHQQAA